MLHLRALVSAPLVAGLLVVSLPAHAADTAPPLRSLVPVPGKDTGDDDPCAKLKDEALAKCRAIQKARDKNNKKQQDDSSDDDNGTKTPPPIKNPRPPSNTVGDKPNPPIRKLPPKDPNSGTPTPTNPKTPKPRNPGKAPPPDARNPNRGGNGGGGGGGGHRKGKDDCCAMAGLGAGIGFFLVDPKPNTQSQRAIDGGFGAVIGGGAGAFMGGAIGLGLGLAAGGVVAGEE